MVIGPSVAKLSPTTRFEFFANVAPKFMKYVSCLSVPLLFRRALAHALAGDLFTPLNLEGTYILIGRVLAIITFLIGLRVVEPTVHKISTISQNPLENPGPPPELAPLQKRFQTFAALGNVLLIVVLVFMIGSSWT